MGYELIISIASNGRDKQEIQDIFLDEIAKNTLKPFGEIGFYQEDGGEGRILFANGKEDEVETVFTPSSVWNPQDIDHAIIKAKELAKDIGLEMKISSPYPSSLA